MNSFIAIYNRLKKIGAISEDIEFDIYMKKIIYIISEINMTRCSFVPMRYESTIGNHVVKITPPFSSFEINVESCNLYNADFDDVEI